MTSSKDSIASSPDFIVSLWGCMLFRQSYTISNAGTIHFNDRFIHIVVKSISF
ncbi:MAG: hypothetical protein ACM31E_02220 [Fibrobacterota bacterium]